MRWRRVRTEDWLAACATCEETVDVFHEKQIENHFVRLCPDCYQERPSDKALLENERTDDAAGTK